MSITATMADTRTAGSKMRSIVFASSIGTIIEWYDFLIYATAAALVFNKAFFPTIDPLAGTLAALGTYAVGFLARPLGGALFGHFGDRLGRKSMLVWTMFIMGLSTFCIGLLPNYASIGVLAPILLILLRIVQGIGLGGEWGGASLMVIEHAPADKRGFYGSFVQIGFPDRSGARQPGVRAGHQTSRSRFSGMGLAHSVPGQHRAAGARHIHSIQDPGDAGVRANEGYRFVLGESGRRSRQQELQDIPDRGRAEAVGSLLGLHADGVRRRVRHHNAETAQANAAGRRVVCGAVRTAHLADVWLAVGQDRPSSVLHHWGRSSR